MTGPAVATVHASCVVVGEAGILLRGQSGSGKSTVARELVDVAGRHGLFARLVGDDRVCLSSHGGRVLAKPHPSLAGLLEIRGVGLALVEYEAACRLRLVLDLSAVEPARLPKPMELSTELVGVTLPRVLAQRDVAASLALRQLSGGFDTIVTVSRA